MKNISAVVIALLFGVALVFAIPVDHGQQQQRLLGSKQCTWGPSYWCKNLTNAKSCNAVRHCIQSIWEKHTVPKDDGEICKICKDMVTQARDQLRSNQTMEELQQVLEGSCDLLPIKVVKKECRKMVDDFIPELVEALSSEMNPDQVCSVAGLCNNAELEALFMSYYQRALDGTLEEEKEDTSAEMHTTNAEAAKPVQGQGSMKLSCGNCNSIASHIVEKFDNINRDEVLENMLYLCGEMSSFSDACANIVLTYFNNIYDHLKENLNAMGVCHISGVCSGKYHQHPEDVKEEDTAIDLAAAPNADIPCELCEQLVQHMRDVLVANTTEAEFKQVLEGLCKQSGQFKDQCISIVDEYYDVIYKSLVNNLNANDACFMIGVCPKGVGASTALRGEIRPLLPVFPPAEIKVTIRKKLGANEPKFTQEEIQQMALPIDRLMGAANPGMLVENGELCTFCEYLMHYIQVELSTPANEAKIKQIVEGICAKMPNTVGGTCRNFVDTYEDAVIALLVQGLNPREVCPKMQICPKNVNSDDMEVFAPPTSMDESDKPTCPLCLFAVDQAQQRIKDDRSKKHIKKVLDELCVRLPNRLQNECVDFVETYSNELIDMLITDFKPQEICVDLKLCPKSNTYLSDLGITLEDDSISSSEEDAFLNEIDDSKEMPVEIVFEHETTAPNCFLCEEVIKTAEKRMGKHATKADIKNALQHSCDKLRRELRDRCHHYVDKYGDKIATLIMKEMEPKVICRELGLCLWSEQEDLEVDEALKYDVVALPNFKVGQTKSDRFTGLDDMPKDTPGCVLCEFVISKLEIELKNKTTQDEIKHTVENICKAMPRTVVKKCDDFIEKYAGTIITLITIEKPKEICSAMMLCATRAYVITDEVVECGVCHGATMSLLSYFKQHLDHSTISPSNMVGEACENLPGKYYQVCSEMVTIYGQSILHLAQQEDIDKSQICATIGKCFNNEQSGLQFARITA